MYEKKHVNKSTKKKKKTNETKMKNTWTENKRTAKKAINGLLNEMHKFFPTLPTSTRTIIMIVMTMMMMFVSRSYNFAVRSAHIYNDIGYTICTLYAYTHTHRYLEIFYKYTTQHHYKCNLSTI